MSTFPEFSAIFGDLRSQVAMKRGPRRHPTKTWTNPQGERISHRRTGRRHVISHQAGNATQTAWPSTVAEANKILARAMSEGGPWTQETSPYDLEDQDPDYAINPCCPVKNHVDEDPALWTHTEECGR